MAAIIAAVDPEDRGLSSSRTGEAQQDLQSGALARSIWAEEPIDLALLNFQAEIVDGDHSLPAHWHGIVLGQPGDGDSDSAH
jgi:hypothetical protein